MDYKIIVAYDKKRGIGKDLQIPWYLPEDLKRFKNLTLNQNLVMGSKTFQSIIEKLGKPLPKRNTIILTRKLDFPQYETCQVFNDLESILKNIPSAWIAGGGEIYKEFLPYTNELYLTEVEADYDCNIFFPELSTKEWELTYEEQKEGFKYLNYKRIT